jgi:short/branched chain acyl-CoA dehydrogenase
MDYDLSAEHVLLRDTIREFLVNEVAPHVDEHERARSFPREIVDRLGKMGWLGIPIPEDEGGAGLDTLAYAIAIEEIGRIWGSLGLIVAAHTSLGCGPIHLAGTPEQKARFLVPMASGQVLGGYGLTEPGAGSDSGGTRTTARLEDGADGGTWVIDGGKRFITNAGQAGNVHRCRAQWDQGERLTGDLGVHRPGRQPRVLDRPPGGEARSPCIGHR